MHGLLLGSFWQPETRLGLTGSIVAGTLVLRLAAGPAGPVSEGAREDVATRLPLFERLALALAGAGATIALEKARYGVMHDIVDDPEIGNTMIAQSAGPHARLMWNGVSSPEHG